MKKTLGNYSILVLFTLLISSSFCNHISDLSSQSINQGSQLGLNGGFPSNPFGFNPFQGLNLDDKFFKIPQVNQQQTTTLQQQQQQPLIQQQTQTNLFNPLNQQQVNINQQQQLNQQQTQTNTLNQQQTNQNLINSGSNNQNSINSGLINQNLINSVTNNQNSINSGSVNSNLINLGSVNQNLNNLGSNNQNIQQSTTQQVQQDSIGPFKFSSSFKHNDLSVSQNRVTSDLTGAQKIFMMDFSLQKQCRRGCTSQFRINKNTGWMTLGVCNKKTVLFNNLKWNRSKVGHGTYMIGSFGGTWSNSIEKQNNVMNSFRYTTNDVLRITFSPRDQTIIFDKKGSNDTFTMQYDWRDEQLHLCGLLYYQNDQIQYLGTKFVQPLHTGGVRDPYDDYQTVQFRLERQFRDSKIRLDRTDIRNIRNFFDNRLTSVRLCHRGSQHSFSSAAFHKNCDGRANTIVIAQSNHGKKFGGYTPVAWDSSSTYGVDSSNKAFLFSITHNQKSTLKNSQYTIYRAPSYGPTFGGGHDLYISNNSLAASNSYCSIGHSYNAVSDCTRLVGGSSFNTRQYQVYEAFFDEFKTRDRDRYYDDYYYDRSHLSYGLRELRNSNIKLSFEDINNLRNYFDRPIRQLRICYRATENSFSASSFHSKCDGQSNTLTIIETSAGRKIGGFSPLAWDTSSNYASDSSNKTFLFSLTYNQKLTLKLPQHTIYKNPSYGPTFGGGHDLHIANNANSGTPSYCNIGYSYNYPYTYGSEEARNRFCGSYKIDIREYQVYQVIFE